jgi:DNA-binding FadR family transcriptional regulator
LTATLPGVEATDSKLGPAIAREIEAEIMDRGWPVGEYLGSESNLIERYQVSRAAIREAIRIVESHGAARMRLGPGGGLRVTAPNTAAVVDPLRLVLDHARVTREQLHEARSSIGRAGVAGAHAGVAGSDNPVLPLLMEILTQLIDEDHKPNPGAE